LDRDRARVYLEALFITAGVPAGRIAEVGDVLQRLHEDSHLWCRLNCSYGRQPAKNYIKNPEGV
jgi:hypothetical protein